MDVPHALHTNRRRSLCSAVLVAALVPGIRARHLPLKPRATDYVNEPSLPSVEYTNSMQSPEPAEDNHISYHKSGSRCERGGRSWIGPRRWCGSVWVMHLFGFQMRIIFSVHSGGSRVQSWNIGYFNPRPHGRIRFAHGSKK